MPASEPRMVGIKRIKGGYGGIKTMGKRILQALSSIIRVILTIRGSEISEVPYYLSINIFLLSDMEDSNSLLGMVNFVYDPIIADTNSPTRTRNEFPCTFGARIIGKFPNFR
jgi:hypothetical protein